MYTVVENLCGFDPRRLHVQIPISYFQQWKAKDEDDVTEIIEGISKTS